MLTEFIENKLKLAVYKLLEDSSYFGEIPGAEGVWASAKTLEGCRLELKEVLEEWLVLKIRAGDNIVGLSIKTKSIERRNNFRNA